MNIFRKQVTPESITGIAALRHRAAVYVSRQNGARVLARDIDGLSIGVIQDFAAGKGDLKPEILQALA